GMRNEELLRESWREIKKHVAYGVDEVSAQDYEQQLEENIRDLVERLKQKRYRAKLIKRHYLPKGNGQFRPLGIPAVEDKLLQVAGTLGSGQGWVRLPAQIPAQQEGQAAQAATVIRDSPIVG